MQLHTYNTETTRLYFTIILKSYWQIHKDSIENTVLSSSVSWQEINF